MAKIPTIPTIESERFVLRELTAGDVAAFWPAFSDPGNMRWWSRAAFTSRGLTRPRWVITKKKSAGQAGQSAAPLAFA